MAYGIYKGKSGAWFAKVPNVHKANGYQIKGFHKGKWNDPRSAAVLWRDKKGREIWGARRWDLILVYKNSAVRRLRSPIHGVCVYKTVSKHKHREVIYPVIAVSWRDFDGEKHTKFFGEKRPSSIEQAELDAFYFAARKRAELTGGVLNVNPFWSCFIVDKGG